MKKQRGFFISLIIKIIVIIFVIVLVFGGLEIFTYFLSNYSRHPSIYDSGNEEPLAPGKPVIYLYPMQKQDTTVRLYFQGKITADYPKYDEAINGWKVTAYPDGRIINKADGQEYQYLFWEGVADKINEPDIKEGFVVKGEDTVDFLREKLLALGLTPKEYNEFIVYWYPRMKDNPYNLISFLDEQYTSIASLKITPAPDSMLRVFMIFKPLNNKIEVPPQKIKSFERKGFVVVEWGGSEIK